MLANANALSPSCGSQSCPEVPFGEIMHCLIFLGIRSPRTLFEVQDPRRSRLSDATPTLRAINSRYTICGWSGRERKVLQVITPLAEKLHSRQGQPLPIQGFSGTLYCESATGRKATTLPRQFG